MDEKEALELILMLLFPFSSSSSSSFGRLGWIFPCHASGHMIILYMRVDV